jgi:hypothetical protein
MANRKSLPLWGNSFINCNYRNIIGSDNARLALAKATISHLRAKVPCDCFDVDFFRFCYT